MKNTTLILSTLLLSTFTTLCSAQVLDSRAQLNAIIDGEMEIEDFEFISLHFGGTFQLENPLTFETAPSWYGLVEEITYSTTPSGLSLEAVNFFGNETNILRSYNPIVIDFHVPQVAVGLTIYNHDVVNGGTITVRYFDGDVELGSDTINYNFSGYHSPANGLDRIIIERTSPVGTFRVAIDDIAFGLPFFCPADINQDRTTNFFDISEFISLFNDEDDIADLNTDGVFNFFDVSIFLTAFASGCS